MAASSRVGSDTRASWAGSAPRASFTLAIVGNVPCTRASRMGTFRFQFITLSSNSVPARAPEAQPSQ
jgi:hypothetical protein